MNDKIMKNEGVDGVSHLSPPSKKSLIAFLGLLGITTYLTIYVVMLQEVLPYIYQDMWTSTPPGTLFPFPFPSGALLALSPMNPLDLIIYKLFIRTMLIYLFTMAVWIVTVFYGMKVAFSVFQPREASS